MSEETELDLMITAGSL